MDKTNYTVLSLVAIVALVAILSMFIHARAAGGITLAADVSATTNAVFDVPRSGALTGNVVAASRTAEKPQLNRYDLDGSGRVDEADADILGRVIDRVEFCPRNKICDWDGNALVETADLYLLNAQILKDRVSQHASAPTEIAKSSVNTFAIATTGGFA